MKPFTIISDSSCDLPESIIKKHNIEIVPFYVSFDHKKYMKEIYELPVERFTSEMVNNNVYPKTSFPPVFDYISKFTECIEKGFDIICVCLTEKFSGSYQSAYNAAKALASEYPESKIFVIDSLLATGAQGLLITQGALMKENGFDVETVYNKMEEIKKTGRVFFTVDSLDYLQKGGRIGKASAFAGNILNIKPVIALIDGELVPQNKARGSKKAIRNIIDLTIKQVGNSPENFAYSFITSVRFEELRALKNHLFEEYKINIEETDIIGATIGTHIGPSVLGICLIKKYDAE